MGRGSSNRRTVESRTYVRLEVQHAAAQLPLGPAGKVALMATHMSGFEGDGSVSNSDDEDRRFDKGGPLLPLTYQDGQTFMTQHFTMPNNGSGTSTTGIVEEHIVGPVEGPPVRSELTNPIPVDDEGTSASIYGAARFLLENV